MGLGFILGLEIIDYKRKSRNIVMRIVVDIMCIIILIF